MQDVLTDDKTATTGYIVFCVQVCHFLFKINYIRILKIIFF